MHLPDNQSATPRSKPMASPLRKSASTISMQVQGARTGTSPGSDVEQSPIHHLNQIELARRWRVSHRTLERWRWRAKGPRYIKIGGRVVYRLADIEAFEAGQARG